MTDDTTTTTAATSDAAATTTTTKKRPWQRLRSGSSGSSGPSGSGPRTSSTDRLRLLLARVLWAVCAIAASILAVAVLLIAIDANTENELVRWIVARADNVDLGYFDLQNPIKDLDQAETNPAQDVKTALFNYGIAAIIWLGLGKFLDKVVRP